ncbi:hypothetical protein AB0E82_05010 [Streptomyces anulatus]|uniref:hypothetical protein n=1 Tax=Streptomyces anulatus TaxID=1892 RepID=UPI003409F3E5
MEADRERVVPGPRAYRSVRFDDVRMRQDGGGATPSCGDLLCGARGERDEPVRSGNEDVQLRLVLAYVDVVRVDQVMDGVDQRLPVPAQGCEELHQRFGGLGVEAEVQVEHVEGVGVFVHPARVQHDRRPSLLGTARSAVGAGVVEPGYPVAVGRGQMAYVDVVGRDRRDPDGTAGPGLLSGCLAPHRLHTAVSAGRSERRCAGTAVGH